MEKNSKKQEMCRYISYPCHAEEEWEFAKGIVKTW
jgi:hypothetical protein